MDRVNYFLSRDSADSGRFTTLFFLEVDLTHQRLHWIRAGHDPALLYDPATDRFEELDGRGVALGLDESIRFEAYGREGWNPGTVVVLATDGLQETRNAADELFGRDRMRDIMRDRASDSAEMILESLVDAGKVFRGARPQTDDLTLVVLKLDGMAAAAP